MLAIIDFYKISEWLSGKPIYWATICAVVFFVLIAVVAATRSKKYIYKGAPDKKIWRDLRIWGVIVLILQIFLYIKFT